MIRTKFRLLFFIVCLSFMFSSACGSDSDISSDSIESDSGLSGDADIDADIDIDAGADSGSESDQLPPWPSGKYISIDEVHHRVLVNDPQMLLLNVSDEEFYNMGHIAGSLKIPWDELEANLGAINSTKHIVIYCRRGVRSESAYTTLSESGYTLLWVMEGGLEEWLEKGYPTVP